MGPFSGSARGLVPANARCGHDRAEGGQGRAVISGCGVRSRLRCDFGWMHVGAAAAEGESQNPFARDRPTLHLGGGKLPVPGGFACQTSEILAGTGRVQGRFHNISGSIDSHFQADSNVAPNAVPGRLRYLGQNPFPDLCRNRSRRSLRRSCGRRGDGRAGLPWR